MDWEAARRLDPQLADDGVLTVMAAEEEMRKAMSRDASLQKARADHEAAAAAP